MTASQQIATAAFQHALDVAQLYKDNSVLVRGIPQKAPRLVIGDEPQPQPEAQPAPQPAPVVNVESKSAPWWVAPLTAAILGTAGVGGGWLLGRPDAQPEMPTAPQQQSLLQYLEDQGYHLPPEKRGGP